MPKLRARSVETIKTEGRYGDGGGLYLVVSESGAKKWVLRYQQAGRRRDMGLGSFPDVPLAAAREKASAARCAAAAGQDPIAKRKAEAARSRRPTFREIAAEVIPLEQAKSKNAKVQYQWAFLLGEAYCGPLLDRMVDEITTSDVERVLRPVWHAKPETARKLHRRIRRVFEHARVRLRDGFGITMAENPARWDDLKALGFSTPEKLSRGPQPSLDYAEAPAFLSALRQRRTMAAQALELLLLTAVRTDAVRRAEWREFDLGAALWTIPVDHLKDKRTRAEPFRVPLAPVVVDMLRAMKEQRTSATFVFPSPRGDQPLSNMAMLTHLKKMNMVGNGGVRWRDPRDGRPIVPHGFRATFRTWAEDQTHFPRAVIEQAMGHQVGTEVERAYRRTDVLERRRELMSEWANALGANVAPHSLRQN
ncbi:integrase arm-type DNA-binding domain-containing protein [Alsobacter sp. KACC 23698]|uniref:Integrase arm-type DNA-binding domain-containing protein n=1 Tax=Alsobacter sp. KACC 23698 TaxID=3149229 RepID=A0AAU7JJX0_9HYPH